MKIIIQKDETKVVVITVPGIQGPPGESGASTWDDIEDKPSSFPPGGGAGGVLSGTYPNPGFAVDMVTQAELDSARGAANGVAELGADSKLKGSQIPQALLGSTRFITFWDATENDPAIPAASEENKGEYYIVTVEGDTEIDGISDWKLGDWIISLGAQWGKVDNTDSVVSVAGKTGIVTLEIADVIGLQAALDAKAPFTPGFKFAPGPAYTLLLSDAEKTILRGVGTPGTLTIPANVDVPFPLGTTIEIMQLGIGQITFQGADGVTINCPAASRRTVNQYAGACLKKIYTNGWWLEGRLE